MISFRFSNGQYMIPRTNFFPWPSGFPMAKWYFQCENEIHVQAKFKALLNKTEKQKQGFIDPFTKG